MTVFILGAGPAGLAAAHGLVEDLGEDVVLVEANSTPGGLAQTIQWNGRGAHDLGPHKIFTLDARLMRRVERLLNEDEWLTREKRSAIFMAGYFLPYPPSPFALIKVYGPLGFVRMTGGYFWARVRQLIRFEQPTTFEADLKRRVGTGLYEALFRPIAQKLWGDPARLDAKLSRGRVQIPKLTEVLIRLLGRRTASDFEALTFRYPRGGLQRLWESIVNRCGAKATFMMSHRVEAIDVDDRKVTTLRCRREDGSPVVLTVRSRDFVVSTLPVGRLAEMMSGVLTEKARRICRDVIVLNDLLLVFLHIDRMSLFDESWIFVPDPDIAYHRISEQESFDPAMTPHGSVVCCEIMSNEYRAMSAKTDEQLVDMTLEGLERMGYAGFRVLQTRVIRLPKSYPVFRPGFEQNLATVLAEFDAVENFRTIGRQGAFNYIGTLDAMDIGYGFAAWFRERAHRSWQTERERTGHYPVLD